MLKRLYSKRSGFTLVEIIIAFAIFSIMAAMIVQILDLSISARRSNNVYQRELAEQEKMLTLIQKTSKDYKDTKGTISFTLGGTKVDLPYDMLSAKVDAENAGEGLNYFISNVNYQADGEISPSDAAGGSGEGAGSSTGSQASRMDTRLTGTGGIGYIWVQEVIKDTFDYSKNAAYAVPKGCTRYYFKVSASDKTDSGNETLAEEDVPYSQYRMFFYDDVKLNAAAGKVPFTDDKGKPYYKKVHEALTVVQVGYVNENVGESTFKGLNSGNFATTTSNNNKYTVQQSGTNGVRIGSPFETSWDGSKNQKGVKFEPNTYSTFYVDFLGEDVTLSTASFGQNGVKADSTGYDLGYKYEACPQYAEKYKEDGKPDYPTDADTIKKMKKHVNIFGAFLYERNYDVTKTPETPETPAPDDGGDES